MHDMTDIIRTTHQWANRVFPTRTSSDVLLKLFEEIGEYVRDPGSGGELADVFILIADLACMHDIDLAEEVVAKMKINRERTWQINHKTGVMQHV